jgi:hypothetical protein
VPNPVTIPDLVDRFRPLTALEETRAAALLEDAWAELTAPGKVSDLDDRLADGRVTENLVRRVVTAMVLRVLRNPEAIRQWSVDDASFTRDQLVSAGFLFVTADELALLRGTPSPSEPVGHISFSASMGWGR